MGRFDQGFGVAASTTGPPAPAPRSAPRLQARYLAVLGLATLFFLTTAGRAAAAEFSAPVHLAPHQGHVTTTDAVVGTGNVAKKFATIDQACLDFQFRDDLLDPGDELNITMDRRDAGSFLNPGSASQASRDFCWSPAFQPQIIATLLDGNAKFTFVMQAGSLTLGSVVLTISGTSR